MQHRQAPSSSPAPLNEAQIYAYDTQGFLRVEGFLDQDQLAVCRGFLDTPAASTGADTGIERWSGLHRSHPQIAEFVRSRHLVDPVLTLVNQPMRIVECYGHRSGRGSFLYMHNGNTQNLVYEGRIRATKNMAYRCEYHDGKLYTTYVKAILYLTDIDEEGGPFCYIEGSHKANFSFPWPPEVRSAESLLSESGHPALRQVPVAAGDMILLNEALLHGARKRRSPGERVLLATSYCPAFMADWSYLERTPSDLDATGYPDLDDEGDFFAPGEVA